MISDTDKHIIIETAKKFHAVKVLLFGSAASDSENSHDIDIAVDGIPEDQFYTFYGELICSLSKPVDVVTLSQKTKFTQLIEDEGITLYA